MGASRTTEAPRRPATRLTFARSSRAIVVCSKAAIRRISDTRVTKSVARSQPSMTERSWDLVDEITTRMKHCSRSITLTTRGVAVRALHEVTRMSRGWLS